MFAVLIAPIPLGLTEQTSKIDLRSSRQVLLYERFTGSDAKIERRRCDDLAFCRGKTSYSFYLILYLQLLVFILCAVCFKCLLSSYDVVNLYKH